MVECLMVEYEEVGKPSKEEVERDAKKPVRTVSSRARITQSAYIYHVIMYRLANCLYRLSRGTVVAYVYCEVPKGRYFVAGTYGFCKVSRDK